jgi:hypothetical protein
MMEAANVEDAMRRGLCIGFMVVGIVGGGGCGDAGTGDVWGQHDGGTNRRDGAPGQDAAPGTDGSVPVYDQKVYAHSPTMLFVVDPNTLVVTTVAAFSWPSGHFGEQMTDIALDEEGGMIGISFGSVYAVDPETAVCTYLADLDTSSFNGLSWVEGVGADPDGKSLVGVNQEGDFCTIDPETGVSNCLGAYGGGLGSSGDLVFVRGAGVFATATSLAYGSDVLVSIDPADGSASVIGPTGFQDIWGLAYWGGQIFGFTDGGEFLTIDPATGAGTLVTTKANQFWGAGVTTVAPVVL